MYIICKSFSKEWAYKKKVAGGAPSKEQLGTWGGQEACSHKQNIITSTNTNANTNVERKKQEHFPENSCAVTWPLLPAHIKRECCGLGEGSVEKSRLPSGIARISTPTPQSGQLGPFYPDVKSAFQDLKVIVEGCVVSQNNWCHRERTSRYDLLLLQISKYTILFCWI